MTEVLEYQIASLKTYVGIAITLLIGLFSLVLYVQDAIFWSVLLYLGAISIGIVVRGRETRGYARVLVENIPGFEYEIPPTKGWKADLEERGEL